MVRIRINQGLSRAWRPSAVRLASIERHLLRSGSCVVWDTHALAVVEVGACAGVQKKKRKRRIAPRGPRTPRVKYNGFHYTVRQLLYIFATANVEAKEVHPGCNNGRCIDPKHQTSKSLQAEQLRLQQEAMGPWNLTNSDE